MIQKSEIATYVILALIALNLILTIYYNNRSQEDYRRWGGSAPATPYPAPAKSVVVATMPSAKQADPKLANMNAKSVASMQDANRANLVNIRR